MNSCWERWSTPEIRPIMRATVGLNSGELTFTSDEIQNISFQYDLFDSSYVLMGPPTVPTGSMSIIDYDQKFNPILNQDLTSGSPIVFELGLRDYNEQDPLYEGEQLISRAQIKVKYESTSVTVYGRECISLTLGDWYTFGEAYRVVLKYTDEANKTSAIDKIVTFHSQFTDLKNKIVLPTCTGHATINSLKMYSMGSYLTNNIVTGPPSVVGKDIVFGINGSVSDDCIIMYDSTIDGVLTDYTYSTLGSLNYSVTSDNKLYIQLPEDSSLLMVDAIIATPEPFYLPYGYMYTSEWSYDSSSHVATVEFYGEAANLLSKGNFLNWDAPAQQQKVFDALIRTISSVEYVVTGYYEPPTAWDVPYCCAMGSFSDTLNSLLVASYANIAFSQNNTLWIFGYNGYPMHDITLTDGDVEAYDIESSSTITYDHSEVDYVSSLSLEPHSNITSSNLVVQPDTQIGYSPENLVSVDYIRATNGITVPFDYNLTGLNFYNVPDGYSVESDITVVGTTIKASYTTLSVNSGQLPYSVSTNPYIHSKDHAHELCNLIDASLSNRARIISVTLRGCPLLWPGCQIAVSSDLFGIYGQNYVVIGIQFDYDGTVSTTLTLEVADDYL